MLIISKFNDYYDSALGVAGVDKTVVYRRKTKEIDANDWMLRVNWFPELTTRYTWHSGSYMDYQTDFVARLRGQQFKQYHLKVFIIGFCGKVYKGVRLSSDITDSSYRGTYHYCLYTLVKEMGRLSISFKDADVNVFDFETVECKQMTEDKIISFISTGEKEYTHHRNRLDVWTDSKNKAYLNPVLKDYQFYRIVDTYTAFQEISMYISGVIGTGEKETITISDEDMRDAKGFDKYSFKNPIRVKDL